jgi:hypothetical protein
MKPHVKIYMRHFSYDESDFIACECGCGQRAVDIHHVESRGMGGRESMDKIDNLIALSRECHDKAHGPLSRWYKEVFKNIIKNRK